MEANGCRGERFKGVSQFFEARYIIQMNRHNLPFKTIILNTVTTLAPSVDCNSSSDKRARKRKKLFHAVGRRPAVHRRRCLHGLCHGSQWPWLTSPVLSASPAVARARRALNHLHPLVTSGSANNSVSFCRELLLLWACPLHGTETVHGGTCGACTVGWFQPGYELWAKR